jgi:hypothetical protein
MSGFLYVAIVVGWAVYLVPFALKRYDEAARNRSIDRFSSAMRVLGRRESGSADDPGRTAPADADAVSRTLPPDATARQQAARTAARRRRRILLMLLLATSAAGAGVAFAVIPPWAVAIPGTLVLLWLLLCRRQARRQYAASPAYPPAAQADAVDRTDRTDRTDQADQPGPTEHPDTDVAGPEAHARPVAADRPADDEPTVVLRREDPVAAETDRPGSGSLWDPVPVTLPTYVHKPRAPRTIRTIDLGAAGVQTSGHTRQSPGPQEASAEPAGPSPRAVGE